MLSDNSLALLSWVDSLGQAQRYFSNKRICFSGIDPMDYNASEVICKAVGGQYLSNSYDWNLLRIAQNELMEGRNLVELSPLVVEFNKYIDNLDLIVVGRQEFDEDFLAYVLPFACRNPNLIVVSQEDLLNHFDCFSEWVPYRRYDPRISEHPALQFLASIGFEWPKFDWRRPSTEGSDYSPGNWSTESQLKKQFGYSAAKGVSVEERRRALVNAVYVLGLETVANFLVSFLINKLQNAPTHADAIERRTEDAEWLKETYYDHSIHQFRWPS